MGSPVKESSKQLRIWMHASSVGEAGAAISIVNSLLSSYPEAMIIFSTSTQHGNVIAKQQLNRKASICIYAPLDFVYAVKRALSFFKPDIMIFFETEIWPNWLYEATRMGIKTVMVNGRISVRSVNNYLKIRSLTRAVLVRMSAFSMISEEDAKRICSMGAPEERVKVNGNAKYDPLIERMVPGTKEQMMKLFNFSSDDDVFVAGSTRTSEEEIVLDVYEEILKHSPNMKLIIAPRHVERAYTVESIVRNRGLSCQLRTDLDARNSLRISSVVIMDTIGELQDVYSVATVVFCGGSLVPKGGHNILEAAVWGKPVLFGPSIEDFADAGNLLVKSGGGIQIQNSREMAETIIALLKDPEKIKGMGMSARQAVLSNMGAAGKHADVIRDVLKSNQMAS
ncbi:MAG: 3-deoxy-D-manno-octulosonic acid transferase [Deltaproteobacteria bacterium]|nr:3-deoxy-D-manno-octulosonic acid transferase [Deltaproteobacteria bacterium]